MGRGKKVAAEQCSSDSEKVICVPQRHKTKQINHIVRKKMRRNKLKGHDSPERTNIPDAQNNKRVPKLRHRSAKHKICEYYSSSEQQPTKQTVQDKFIVKRIQCILWSKQQGQFLVKYHNRSYLHCEWLNQQQLQGQNYEVGFQTMRSIRCKMDKTIEMKLGEGVYFNPNYLLVDRVVACSDMLHCIQPSRIDQLKGSWLQSMTIVCNKLIYFVKNGFPYGVHLQIQIQQHKRINWSMLAEIGVRIYLDNSYRKYEEIWRQIGEAINFYLRTFPVESNDFHLVGMTIRECAIFLYKQWYKLSLERYLYLQHNVDQKIIRRLQERYMVQQESNDSLMSQLCRTNILINRQTELPSTWKQLKKYDPRQYSFGWLEEDESKLANYQYSYLSFEDFKQLDMNKQISKVYLVKWQDLSYKDLTWETENNINPREKIDQFLRNNRLSLKEKLTGQLTNIKLHNILLQNSEDKEARNKLYHLEDVKQKQSIIFGSKNMPIFKNNRRLKSFQLQSLNWLVKNWCQGRNSILADEMGLGKTIQSIAFLQYLSTHEQMNGPFLVLAPLTTLHQWRKQFEEWTNMNCLLYYDQGQGMGRQIIRQSQFYYNEINHDGQVGSSNIYKFDVLLTNYELFINDFHVFRKIPFQHMILDEAHRLKNKNSRTTKVLKELPCCRKTLLTGTPIQNNTNELWTLLNFIEPQTFEDQGQFLSKYQQLKNQQQVNEFKKMLKPYLLRRVKQDVQTSIPKLSQIIIDVEMTKLQKQYYRGLIEKSKNEMIKGLSSANFNSISMQLRKCCNHPYLIADEIEETLIKGCNTEQEQTELFVKSSGKVSLLLKLMAKFKRESKKILLFSQFVKMIDLLKHFLTQQQYTCEVLKGSLNESARHQAISRFNRRDVDVFLISTKAGGVGINLITATQIIIYDSDWNPQNDIQATARAHRIGQSKEVTVYRLITATSYQSQMFRASSKKLGLDQAVFSGQCFKSLENSERQQQKMLTKEETEILLKQGVLGFLENEQKCDEYFQQNIEDILSKNARKVQYSSIRSSCAFSKTIFKGQQGNSISIDAPNFWQVALKDVKTPIEKLLSSIAHFDSYTDLQPQQQLMLRTYNIVQQFVRRKTIPDGINTDQEIKLIQFLQTVGEHKAFHRKYRQIAGSLIEEIEKPSRRFRVKKEEIYQLQFRKNAMVQEEEEEENLSEYNENNMDGMKEQYKSEIESLSHGESDDKSDHKKYGEELDISPISDKKVLLANLQSRDIDVRAQDNYDRACSHCLRPKCLMFCKGICGRAYHRICWQKMLTMDPTKTPISALEQTKLSFEAWQASVSFDDTCTICSQDIESYFLECSICHIKGTFSKQSFERSKSKNFKMSRNNYNPLQVYKCNMLKCLRYFHVECLYSEDYMGKFSDRAGKIVKSVVEPSISFRCPVHYCSQCYMTDTPLKKAKTFCCVVCCRTVHFKCIDKLVFVRLKTNVFICRVHLTEEQLITLVTQYEMMNVTRTVRKRCTFIKNINEETGKKTNNNVLADHEGKVVDQRQSSIKQLSRAGIIQRYLDANIISIDKFNYQSYNQPWCRYCGARYTTSFRPSPWGANKLCSHHHVLWKKGKLNLTKFPNEPTEPIDKYKDTQIKFLTVMAKHHSLSIRQIFQRLSKTNMSPVLKWDQTS